MVCDHGVDEQVKNVFEQNLGVGSFLDTHPKSNIDTKNDVFQNVFSFQTRLFWVSMLVFGSLYFSAKKEKHTLFAPGGRKKEAKNKMYRSDCIQ